MKKKVSIFNFTNVYNKESFYRDDKSSISCDIEKEPCVDDSDSCETGNRAGVEMVDFSAVSGTNCMCDDGAMSQIRSEIRQHGIGADEIHFIDNGNYHYMPAIMLEQVKEPFSLVVFDHHPDMQPPMFGDILSCGGWVLYALENNPNIRDVHIIGADRKLIDELPDDVRERAHFYDVYDVICRRDYYFNGSDVHEKRVDGESASCNDYDDIDDLKKCVILPETQFPVYISVDKDVVTPDEITTNWDQGEMRVSELLATIDRFFDEKKVIGVDICGECAPEQEGINVDEAIAGNDAFNGEILERVLDHLDTV